jgi:hypothetical protein
MPATAAPPRRSQRPANLDPPPPAPASKLVTVSAADIKPRSIEWLWPNRIPLGAITILAGLQGLGKSFLSTDLAARVSNGAPWPDLPDRPNPCGSTLIFAAEDDGMVEGDLPAGLRRAYAAELQAFYTRVAESVADTSVGNHGFGGRGRGEDFTEARVLHIDESAMRGWMVRDPEAVLERYQNVIGGRLSVRRALQLSPAWTTAVLRDGATVRTGDDLRKYLLETADTLDRLAVHEDNACAGSGQSSTDDQSSNQCHGLPLDRRGRRGHRRRVLHPKMLRQPPDDRRRRRHQLSVVNAVALDTL